MNKNDRFNAALKFAPLLEKYFLTYLIAQKKSSPRTVSTYRDSFTLYLRFMASVYGIAPDRIEMNHFSLDHLSAFGTYLETIRSCSPLSQGGIDPEIFYQIRQCCSHSC